jgi:thiol:disulfide interchange protein DsbC
MLFKATVASLALMFGLSLQALAGEPAPDKVVAKLRASLETEASGLTVGEVSISDLPGLYEVQFTNGPLVFATENGEFFLVGDLFQVTQEGFVNLGELRRNDARGEMMAAVERDDMIVFPARGATLAHITVFTDISCGYCRKLHREVPELNKQGVEVRYVAYPRGGVGSEGYRQLATAWCSDNPSEALTRMKGGENISDNVCPGNPVADQYTLGQKAGVRGTPAIVLESGEMLPGYMPADQLLVTLGLSQP